MLEAVDGTKTQVRYYSTKKHYYQRIEDNTEEALRASKPRNNVLSFMNSTAPFWISHAGQGALLKHTK